MLNIEDYRYKYLTNKGTLQANVLVKPRLRKHFIFKWYFFLQELFSQKPILSHKGYRYRFDNAGLRYVIIYVPFSSPEINIFYWRNFIFWPFLIKRYQKRLHFRILIDKYYLSISFIESHFSKEIFHQLLSVRLNGQPSTYNKELY